MSNFNVTKLIDWQMKDIMLEFHFLYGGKH
jgi:hypothetical protein